MCNREVLAIKFRLVCFLKEPVTLKTLLDKKVINGQPQSITKIGEERILWLQEQTQM